MSAAFLKLPVSTTFRNTVAFSFSMRILSCVVMIRLVVFLGISNLRIIYKKSPFYFYLHNQYNTITNRDKDKSQRIKDTKMEV